MIIVFRRRRKEMLFLFPRNQKAASADDAENGGDKEGIERSGLFFFKFEGDLFVEGIDFIAGNEIVAQRNEGKDEQNAAEDFQTSH